MGEAGAGIDKALGLLRRHRQAGLFRMVALQHPHFTKAIRLLDTVACALRTLDALHLAVALSDEPKHCDTNQKNGKKPISGVAK